LQFSKQENILVVLIVTAILTSGIAFILSGCVRSREAGHKNQNNISVAIIDTPLSAPTPTPLPPPQKLSNPPAIIRSIYVTGYSAGSKSYLNYLTSLFKNTDINAVVVDVKGSDGHVTYASGAEDVKKYNLDDDAISNIDDLVRFFHSQNIYVIGRIAVFEDPVFAKARPDLAIYNEKETLRDASGQTTNLVLWKDNNKLSWMDPASKDVWNYDVSLAQDAFGHGFDEVNFDYVRFPTDGQENNMGFPVWDGKTPMADVIDSFFKYVHANLANDPTSPEGSAGRGKISADLFGLTTVNNDDMGIGQPLPILTTSRPWFILLTMQMDL